MDQLAVQIASIAVIGGQPGALWLHSCVSAQQLQVVGVSDPAVHTGARSRGWL
jgi:hypothetical protein